MLTPIAITLTASLALRQRLQIYFQHDESFLHFSMNVKAHLNEQFRGRWIGRGLKLATAFTGSQP
jgi:hypothetical protein